MFPGVTWQVKLDPISIGTLRRLVFRLLVVIAFAGLWPGTTPSVAAAALLVALAAGCLIAAIALGENVSERGLNRWHEAAVLFTIAGIVYWLS